MITATSTAGISVLSGPVFLNMNAISIGMSVVVNNIILRVNSLRSFSNIAIILPVFISDQFLSGNIFKYFSKRRIIRPDIDDFGIE